MRLTKFSFIGLVSIFFLLLLLLLFLSFSLSPTHIHWRSELFARTSDWLTPTYTVTCALLLEPQADPSGIRDMHSHTYTVYCTVYCLLSLAITHIHSNSSSHTGYNKKKSYRKNQLVLFLFLFAKFFFSLTSG